MKKKTWAQERAIQIWRDLHIEYGPGLQRLSDEQRDALVCERVLMLVISQMGEEYQPAVKLAREVLGYAHRNFGNDDVCLDEERETSS